MTRILLYTTPFCGYCQAARRLLAAKGLDFEEVDVAFDAEKRAEMIERARGLRTVPQIFIHGRHVGGYEELAALEREGKLDAWLVNGPEALEPEALEPEALEPEALEPETLEAKALERKALADAEET